jgi:hypothetical protein
VQRIGFKLYEPDAELILAKAHSKDIEKIQTLRRIRPQKSKRYALQTSRERGVLLLDFGK